MCHMYQLNVRSWPLNPWGNLLPSSAMLVVHCWKVLPSWGPEHQSIQWTDQEQCWTEPTHPPITQTHCISTTDNLFEDSAYKLPKKKSVDTSTIYIGVSGFTLVASYLFSQWEVTKLSPSKSFRLNNQFNFTWLFCIFSKMHGGRSTISHLDHRTGTLIDQHSTTFQL